MSCGMDHKKMKMGKKCPECGHEKDEKDEMGKSAGLFGDKSLKAVDEHIKSIDDMWIMKGPQPGRAEWQKEHDQAVGAHKKSPSEATRHGLFRSAMRHPSNGGLTDHWAQVHGRANGGTTQASVTAAYNHPERRALRKKLGLPDGHEETMTKFMKKSAFDMGMMAKIAELQKAALTVLDVAKRGAAIGGTIGAIRGARKAKAEGKSVAGGALKGGAGGALIGGVAVPSTVVGGVLAHHLLTAKAKAR